MNKKELNPAITAPNWLRKLFAFLEFISPILTSRIATLFFFTPIRFNTPKLEFEISNNSLSKTIKFKNNKIKIYEWGKSKNAVLLVACDMEYKFNDYIEDYSEFLKIIKK